MEIKKVKCHLCLLNCDMLAHTEDDILKKITNDPEYPFKNMGARCQRGASVQDRLYNINRSLSRIRDMRSKQFKKIPLEDTLELLRIYLVK